MKRSKARPCGQRTQRKPRKLDRKKVLALQARGFTTPEIAKQQGVAPSTVWRFLQQTEPERVALEQFKSQRADQLAKLQGKAIKVQHLALDRLRADLQDDRLSSALSPTAKTQYLNAATVAGGTSFDKERLERGQSTANISTITKMINAHVTTMYKPKSATAPPAIAAPASKKSKGGTFGRDQSSAASLPPKHVREDVASIGRS